MKPYETIEYKSYKIEVHQDQDPLSPADWDQAGTIYTKHNRYFAIGEDLNKVDGQEVADDITSNGGELLPVFAYVHGGVALSAGPFGCMWDSGQCGFIAMTKDKIISEYGDDSEQSRERARKLMKAEIESWDDYFRGNVWGFILKDPAGEEIESCWGFYGEIKDMVAEVKSMVDAEEGRRLPLLDHAGLVA
jgi:hypothetical protein